MRSTTQTDDKQLWRLVDVIDGVEKAWPIYATPSLYNNQPCYLVELAIPVNDESQWKFVSERLAAISFYSDGPRWLVRTTYLEKAALKCRGVTPEYYLKWGDVSVKGPVSPNVETPQKTEKADCLDDDFVRHVCVNIGETNLPLARLFFNQFCHQALSWLLVEHKPLNMGFCTLHALPLRKNWQGILHAKWPNILSIFRRNKGRDDILEAIGFMAKLHYADMMEMQTDSTFGWSIEAVESKHFAKHVLKMEQEIFNNCEKPGKYVKRHGGLVAKFYDKILDIFSSYLEKAALPSCHLDQTSTQDNWRLRPKTRRGRVRPAIPKVPDTYYSTAPHNPDDGPVAAAEVDVEEAPEVSDVPDAGQS